MIECKYHNRPGLRSDLRVALYTHAQFLDVEQRRKEIRHDGKNVFHQAWLVTNTKCTSTAIRYARCVNLRIIAWRYPSRGGLEHFIEKKKLYPVTVLPSLSGMALRKLGYAGILLAKDLLKYSPREAAKFFRISPRMAEKIRQEAEELCA